MGEEEFGEQVVCDACRDPIWVGAEPSYALAEGRYLCLSCALARGGSHDGDEDRWTIEPNVDDLLEKEARPIVL
jgi:hypothetical protein